jgi:hypothetical protein
VVNRSKNGILLTTGLPVEIGMPVLVKRKNYTENDAQDELKEEIHAQVVRCDKQFTFENGSCYQVAIEHFELYQ